MIVIRIRHRLHPIGYITNRCADKERWGVQFQLCQGVSIMLLNLLLFYVDALKWVKYSTAPSDLEINCGLGSLPNRMLCSSLVNKSVGWPKYRNNYYRWDQIAEKQKFYEILANNAIMRLHTKIEGKKRKKLNCMKKKRKRERLGSRSTTDCSRRYHPIGCKKTQSFLQIDQRRYRFEKLWPSLYENQRKKTFFNKFINCTIYSMLLGVNLYLYVVHQYRYPRTLCE